MANVELSTVVDGVTIELNGSSDLAVKDLGISTAKLAADAVTYAKLQNVSATDRLLGRDTAAAGDVEELTVGGGVEFTGSGGIQRSALTGDVTATAGSGVTTIATAAVTNAKRADMAQALISGRAAAAGTGVPTDLTADQVSTILDAATIPFVRKSRGFRLNCPPLVNEPPTANPATAGLRNQRPFLAFDGATDEEAVWTQVLPINLYAGSGLTVDTYWSFTSATSGSLRVQAAIERTDLSGLDIDADSFAAFNSAGGTAPATSGMVIKVMITFASGAEMDSLAAGELFRLKIRRDADGTSGTDDIATDAELLYATIRET